ncbi:MAG TPA: choice-of-anchor Q domain-containing protein, partial [Candidatus Acidoferrales bacterium]|nr:choice-of-anchor Q domain-containing protein [Candidatus Acidoferrales bacterium]
ASNGGGGIYATNTETISGSTIKGNTVVSAGQYEGGGGIYIDSAMTILNSTISGNAVTVAGGITYAGGGGIYNNSGLTMAGSTVSGNVVLGSGGTGSGGGGIFSYDSVSMINSTINGNRSSMDGGGYMTYQVYSNVLSNVTLYQNSATGSGGNIANPSPDTITLTNTIVAGGSAGTGADIDNGGVITSGDYNIVQTAVVGTALTGTTTHNVTANPLLLALTNNGGPTFTDADTSASPGRADIPFSGGMCNGVTGTNVDQRGFARGAGARCDAGAYEFAGVAGAIRQHPTPARGNHHHQHRARAHRNPALPTSATR